MYRSIYLYIYLSIYLSISLSLSPYIHNTIYTQIRFQDGTGRLLDDGPAIAQILQDLRPFTLLLLLSF